MRNEHHQCSISDLVLDRFFLQIIGDINQKFPPFNIGKNKLNENEYILQLAVAGFSINDITIILERNILTIASTVNEHSEQHNEQWDYYINGIAKRKFIRKFSLFNNDQTEITKASLDNGILSIFIQRVILEKDKPKTIPIELPKINTLNLLSQ